MGKQKNTPVYLVLTIAFFLSFAVELQAGRYPFQNPDLTSAERAADLISRLTLEEKAALMCDQSDAIPRLGNKTVQLVE